MNFKEIKARHEATGYGVISQVWTSSTQYNVDGVAIEAHKDRGELLGMVKELQSQVDALNSPVLKSEWQEQQDRIEELEQQVCDECDPDDYGWVYNAVEGRAPCTCIIESGAYQELQAKLAATELLRDVALGEAGIERQRTLKEHNKRIAAEAKNIELQEQVNKIAEFFPVCGEVQCTEQYQKIQAVIKGEEQKL